MRTRSAESLTTAYKAIKERWDATGIISPNWHMQFVRVVQDQINTSRHPPTQCSRESNSDIQKSFNLCFSRCVRHLPIHQWDDLLTQTVLTLNLLRQSNMAPNISAYSYHHGPFDYN
ncbi:hypothetical protein ACHAW6_010576 [Cyclotella cf. meneghiniana]